MSSSDPVGFALDIRPAKSSPTRRRFLQCLAAGTAAFPGAASCATSLPRIAVPDCRRAGDRDDTAAAMRAMELVAARSNDGAGEVHFPAGGGVGPGGAYLLRALPLRSGMTLCGDGARSVLKAPDDATMSVILAMSDTAEAPLTDLALRDLRIEGTVARTGFREHWNLVSLSGVSGVRIDRVEFAGFAGDGLYLGAERQASAREPRIVRNIVVSDCLFDGITNQNRNGISVTGGIGITIDRCRFRSCSKSTMPGPIDFEPDAFSFYRLERLRITNCDFEGCGGNIGQIALVIPAVVPPPRHVHIAGNRFRGYRGTGGDIAITINREPDTTLAGMDCVIERNVGIGGNGGVQIFSAKGVIVRGNHWMNYAGRGFAGFAQAAAGVTDVSVSDRFEGCGWRDGVAFAVYKGDDVRIEDSGFARTGNGGPGSAPLYLGPGRIRRLTIARNDFRDNPAARGIVIVERGTDFEPSDGNIAGNMLPPGRALLPS